MIENIIDQKVSNLKVQIIISDNKDYTNGHNEVIEFLKNIENKIPYKFAYFLAESPIGQYNNFNRCIELSNTECIGMIHDDDLLVNNYFCIVEKTLYKINKSNDIAMIHGSLIPFSGNIKVSNTRDNHIYKISSYEMAHMGQTGTGIPSCGTIFFKSKFIESGGFNESYPSSGDAIIAAVMKKLGYDIYQFSKLTGYYRIGINSSLRLEICQGFIKEDYYFMSEWCQSGLIEKIEWKLYKDLVYSENIDTKISSFAEYNKEINVKNLDFRNSYKKYSRYSILKIMYAIEWKFISLGHRLGGIQIKC